MEKIRYKPADLAKMFKLHPNTIRLYEKLGYITPAARDVNGYRQFGELQLWQIKVCRCIFGYPFTKKHIRKAGNQLMVSLAKKEWHVGREYTQRYIQAIYQELLLAKHTATILKSWTAAVPTLAVSEETFYSRNELAKMFGVTVETIRSWERNMLIASEKKGAKGEVLYSNAAVDRVYVVYMLRQAGYSVAAIHRSLIYTVNNLHQPGEDDLISVGDRWLYELNNLLKEAQKIPKLIDTMSLF